MSENQNLKVPSARRSSRIRKPPERNDYVTDLPPSLRKSQMSVNPNTLQKPSSQVVAEETPQSSPPSPPVPQNTTRQKPSRTADPTATDRDDSDPNRSFEDALNQIYTNFASPAAFSGALESFIRKKRSISLHRKRRKVFKRRKFISRMPLGAV